MALEKEVVAEIKAEIALGEKSLAEIARQRSVSRSTISHIANGRMYVDVPTPKVAVGKVEVNSAQHDPTDMRVVELQSENISLKQELLIARRTAKAAGKQHGLFRAVADEIQSLKPFTALPLQVDRRIVKSKIQESLVMHLSDGHHDEIVVPEECGGLEEYNFEITSRRAERYVDTTLDFTLNALSNYQFTDLTILAYGDNTSGEIHGAMERSYFRNQFKNCLAIGRLHALMFRDLCPYFASVNVLYLPGNHGRRSNKKDHHGAHDNWDYLVAKTAETHCAAIPNLSFTIPNAFSANVEINGITFNVSHGDDCRGHQGIPFYSMLRRHGNLMKLGQMQNTRTPVRYSVMGHHHVAASLQDMNGACLVNGAWVGTNAYAYNSFSGYREPSQLIHGVNERHGVTWKMDVQLRGQDDREGPKRYKVEV